MEKLPGKNQPFWKTTAQAMNYSKLEEDIEIDIAIIGGGISGILTAYLLAKEGKSVALLEARELKHVLIIGGETHPKRDGKSTIEHYKEIQHYVKETFGLTEMLGYWSEHDHISPDRRPFIGKIQPDNTNMYVMTGYNKWGLAAAATSAQLITALIVGDHNRFEKLFSPDRKLPIDDMMRMKVTKTMTTTFYLLSASKWIDYLKGKQSQLN